uniref:COX assembly mitochondrial protein homolog n=1 Tax=Ciona intestinalis TaxID=7719 RepID=UPI0005214A9C|nr:COX assembly mitochondrial protein homolog [Ciona intestinalis]|eukprot:XP_009858582.1 COX assembly mitochondrial protein homolog [Ciona intestinalis]
MASMPYIAVGVGGLTIACFGVYHYGKHYSSTTAFHIKDNDPDLRKVEKDVMVPKYMRELSHKVDCAQQVENFNNCCKNTGSGKWKGFKIVSACRAENNAMMECMNEKFLDPEFYEKCKQLYLSDKRLFKMTGVSVKERKYIKHAIVNGEQLDINMSERALKYYDSLKDIFEKTKDIDHLDQMILSS